MKRNYIQNVIKHFFNEKHSNDTTQKVQQWLIDEEHHEEKNNVLYELWENSDNTIDHNTYQALSKIKNELGLKEPQKKNVPLQLKIIRVAAILLLCLIATAGIYFFYNHTENPIEYITQNGEVKTIELPDGSKVWLNAGSSFSYKNKDRKRTGMLSGEAFFIVAPDSLQPFIVETHTLVTEVLGTEFNIEDYPDSPNAIATLNTGKISIKVAGIDNAYMLIPNQQLTYSQSSGIEIQQLNVNEITGWKEGKLIFHNNSFDDIIHKLERHFNLKIIIHDLDYPNDHYSVKFIHGESIEEIMHVLKKMTGNFTYEITQL